MCFSVNKQHAYTFLKRQIRLYNEGNIKEVINLDLEPKGGKFRLVQI